MSIAMLDDVLLQDAPTEGEEEAKPEEEAASFRIEGEADGEENDNKDGESEE